jgi:hypothetical protein
MAGKTASGIGEHRLFIIIGVIVVAAFLFSILHGGSHSGGTGSNSESTQASASLIKEISSIPTSTFDTIGTGTATGKPQSITAPALTENNKPEIFYEGAEYCPYCATERWAMTAALSRFGTFSKLGVTESSSSDVYPSTQTLSYYHADYTSQYVSFVPIEVESNVSDGEGGYEPLQTPTSAEETLTSKYDAAPYLPSNEAGSIPFIDFGGKYLVAGATYNPGLLQGLSRSQIASDMHKPTSKVAQGADGATNALTATICELTNNQPATTCDPTIQQIEKSL